MDNRTSSTKRTWLGWVHDFLARTGLAQHDPEASLTAQQLACVFLGVAVTSCLAACVTYKQLELQLQLANMRRPGSRTNPQVSPASMRAKLLPGSSMQLPGPTWLCTSGSGSLPVLGMALPDHTLLSFMPELF